MNPPAPAGRSRSTPPKGWRVAGEVNLLEDAIEAPSRQIRPFEIRSWRLRRKK